MANLFALPTPSEVRAAARRQQMTDNTQLFSDPTGAAIGTALAQGVGGLFGLSTAPTLKQHALLQEMSDPRYRGRGGGRMRPIPTQKGWYDPNTGQIIESDGEALKPSWSSIDTRRQYAGASKAGGQGVGGSPLTPAQLKVDESFGTDYAEYTAGGGFADIQKGLEQLKYAADSIDAAIKSGETNLSGQAISLLPDPMFRRTYSQGANIEDTVAEVTQRNLRAILGGQFAQKEGEQLIARAYDRRQPEEVNLERVKRLGRSIAAAAKAKDRAIKYYEKNGTLRGYDGKLPTIQSISEAAFGKEKQRPNTVPQEIWDLMTDEEQAAF